MRSHQRSYASGALSRRNAVMVSHTILRAVLHSGRIRTCTCFPFLLENDGSPWVDANAFLFKSARDFEKGFIKSEVIIYKASLLLDYKILQKSKTLILCHSGRRKTQFNLQVFFELLSLLDKGQVTRKRLK